MSTAPLWNVEPDSGLPASIDQERLGLVLRRLSPDGEREFRAEIAAAQARGEEEVRDTFHAWWRTARRVSVDFLQRLEESRAAVAERDPLSDTDIEAIRQVASSGPQ